MRQTTRENMLDLAQNLGIDARGKSKSEVMGELENLAGGVTEADLDAAISRHIDAHGVAVLDEDDWDLIFGDD